MATSNRGGNRSGNRRRSGRNNNPEGRNQHSRSPLATAAAVGGAVAAGVFLWSRRNQISEQIESLADQLSEWREGGSGTDDGFGRETGGRSQVEIAEEALTLKELGESA